MVFSARSSQLSSVDGIPGDINALRKQRAEFLFKYVSTEGSKGTVAVTLSDYNHEYHAWTWVRDGALIIKEVFNSLSSPLYSGSRQRMLKVMTDYIDFSRRSQDAVGLAKLGEPRFDFLGQAYKGEWGRPQNDGPALRTLTLIKLANVLDRNNPSEMKILNDLYKAEPATQPHSLIKRDLEYIARTFKEKSVDLWEEKRGQHFFTLIVQRKALLEGEKLARSLNDPFAADHYRQVAAEISRMLDGLWDKNNGFINAAYMDDNDHKSWRHPDASNLDIAVILGVLHGESQNQSFGVSDARVLATALRTEEAFKGLYEINRIGTDQDGRPIAPAIGRYPEDVYNGHPEEAQRFTGGHPWVLATHAMAEFYFKHSAWISQSPFIEVNEVNRAFYQALLGNRTQLPLGRIHKGTPNYGALAHAAFEKGVAFRNRVNFHLPADQPYSEMIDRTTGQRQSIPSLAWSDASALSMMSAYIEARDVLPQR